MAKNGCRAYLFLLGFANFANENKVLLGGLLAVDIATLAMEPAFAGVAKDPHDCSVRPEAVLFVNGAEAAPV